MKKPNSSSAITIGIDLGDRKHAVCVLDALRGILDADPEIQDIVWGESK